MKLEKVFQLYRRALKWSIDYCDTVYIIKKYPGDMYDNPTEVTAIFKPNKKRLMTAKELKNYDDFKLYNKINYHFNDDGDMVWE